MARFTSPDGTGAPGPTGPTGADGADGVGVPPGGSAGDILAKIDGSDFNTEWIENYTSTVKHLVKYVGNPTIPIGTPVYAVLNGNENSSTNIPVNVASNASEATSSKTMGLVEESVAKNGFVYVVTEGLVAGIDTSTANTGDPVWLGENGAYIFGLANKPTAPAHLVFLGVVTRGQQENGEIFVKVQNGFELDELHTVSLEATASIADNEILAFDSASGLWKNQTASEAGLATSAPLTLSQSGNHSSYPLTISSANEQDGGAGYVDILKLINSKSGATNPAKHIRLNSTGGLEIVNDAYSTTIFAITDSGAVSTSGAINSATIGDTGWTNVSSFSNSFVSGGNTPGYRKINGVVYLRGNIGGGTANTTAFILPVGYRPTTDFVIVTQQLGTANLDYVTIYTDGRVVPNATSTWLTGITFPI